MSGSKLYYIYLDTKIVGAVEQLIGYFRAQIFNKNDCISVVCKFYKEIDLTFTRLFKAYDIPFIFVRKQSDLVLAKGKTVFYLFNAQSNCRLVANRDLTHIFVTHGESHKAASIKPIIRIYDYVVTSGNVGIDRYLKSGIFSPYDVESGKIITLGDTFLGGNDFEFKENSYSMVYAPTWEGGIPSENYCSLNLKNAKRIVDFSLSNNITKIFVKPHPNIGHRDLGYKEKFDQVINYFQNSGLKVFINKKIAKSPWLDIFMQFKKNNNLEKKIEVSYAITDISAMEMQFISRNIPCVVLADNQTLQTLLIPKVMNKYYSRVLISENENISFHEDSLDIRSSLMNYLITYPSDEILKMDFRARINWLCEFTSVHKKELREKLINEY